MTYTKIHLKLERHNFVPVPISEIKQVPCSYDYFKYWVEKVGGRSGWHKRPEYQDPERIDELRKVFADKTSRFWVFMKGQEEIGFCQLAQIENLRGIFNDAAGVTEIYKIGLTPNHVGKGLGRGYVSAVAREVFRDRRNQTIYLNTRDTNVVNPLNFYRKLGFEVFRRDVLPDST